MENTANTAPVKVKLSKSAIAKQLEDGVTKPELAKFYGLNANQMTKALKQMGLSNKRAKKVEFEIVDEEADEETKAREMVEGPAHATPKAISETVALTENVATSVATPVEAVKVNTPSVAKTVLEFNADEEPATKSVMEEAREEIAADPAAQDEF